MLPRRVGSLLALALFALGPQGVAPQATAPTSVVIETTLGEIEVLVDLHAAPLTAANFLSYVDEGLYAGGSFYRSVRMDNQPDDSVRIEVVQGGMDRGRRDDAFPPIRLEGTGETGLAHEDGVISMARAGPNSARAEFFICVGDQPELDEGGLRNPDGLGFAAFGRVVRGMDVVHLIHGLATEGQMMTDPVPIVGARRAGGR